MKQILCFAALMGLINLASAQNTNPWPATGDVGIGTASPATALHVKTASAVAGFSNITIDNSGATGNEAGINFKAGYTTTSLNSGRIYSLFDGGTGSANARLTIQSLVANGVYDNTFTVRNGNVGIGTTNPAFSSGSGLEIERLGPATLRLQNTTDSKSMEFRQTNSYFSLFNINGQNTILSESSGNVGIGTIAPNGKLDILNNFAAGTGGSALIVSAKGSGSSSGTTIYGAQVNASTALNTASTQTVYGIDVNATALGTGPSPLTAVNANTVLSRLSGSTATAYYGGKFQLTGATGTSTASNVSNYGLYGEVANTNSTGEVSSSYGVFGKVATVASATAYGGYFTATGGTKNYGVYSAAGTNYFNDNVIIGTTTVPTGYKLAVNGSVIATAVTVKLNAAWPDYVFNKDYKLPTLAEVKDYIGKNHHLPEMPSEKEVAANGLNLGEMNKLLTKKVEELTLHLIEQQEESNKLKANLENELKTQQQQINQLIKQVNLLNKTLTRN